jgi:DNA polymerase III epsilon subunit-like protein
MSNQENKDSKGYFEKFLAFDCETSGINFESTTPDINYQMVSCGLVVSDLNFRPLAELYVEIKWNGTARWDKGAERIHKLSMKYLDENGLTEEEAAVEIGSFLLEHFGSETPIVLLGHNVGNFDIFFLKKLLKKFDIPAKFSHRTMDTFGLSMGTVQCYNSDELFEVLDIQQMRNTHNALYDAKYALEVFRKINRLWTTRVMQ